MFQHVLYNSPLCTMTNKLALIVDIKFAQAYLLAEIPVGVIRCPSAASGLKVFDEEAGGMTWLVESKCASVVISFISTLDHKARGSEDIQSETVHTFAHYIFGYSGGELCRPSRHPNPCPREQQPCSIQPNCSHNGGVCGNHFFMINT